MKWLKDNGQEIETNDLPATIAHCESLGWKKVEKKNRAAKKVADETKPAE